MNCTEHTRYLGRSLTLTTSEGRVEQVDHHESMPGRAMFSATAQPTQRDDVRIHFDDGRETSVAVLGRAFRPKLGQRVTAVNATTKRGDAIPLLYCFNHATRKGWLNTAALGHIRRRTPYRKMIWLLPLLLLFAAWMSPATARADLTTWVGEKSGMAQFPLRSDTSQHQHLNEMMRHVTATILPNDTSPSRRSSARAFAQTSALFVLAGWRERDWVAFGVVAGLVMVGCVAIGHLLIVVPSTMRFRRGIKRLAKQHRRATENA